MAALTIAFVAATALVLWPFAPWILFAIWTAEIIRPLHARVAAHTRPRISALVLTLAIVSLAVPAIIALVSLATTAYGMVERVVETDRLENLLEAHGERAWSIAQQVAGSAARVATGAVIAFVGIYALLVEGDRLYRWLEAHSPFPREPTRRLGAAVIETGRGLFFGIAGAGFVQAIVATVLYVVLGVPEPFALGLLTLACSVVPAVGTSLVWGPVAIALALDDRTAAAITLAAFGLLVIGTIDNLVKPYLARRGRLQLPTLVVALAIFGGIAAFGPRGILIGPLVVRLTKELLVLRE